MAERVPKFPLSGLSRDSRPWGREIENLLKSLIKSRDRADKADLNVNKTQNSTMEKLSDQIRALPLPVAAYEIKTSFSLAATIYVQTIITVPPGKTKMTLTAIGNVAALDKTSGGVAVALGFIEVNGAGFTWSSPVVPASKDSGASFVNNIITPALGFQQEGLVPGNTFFVALGIYATNGAAFPSDSQNYGTLTVTCIFFD